MNKNAFGGAVGTLCWRNLEESCPSVHQIIGTYTSVPVVYPVVAHEPWTSSSPLGHGLGAPGGQWLGHPSWMREHWETCFQRRSSSTAVSKQIQLQMQLEWVWGIAWLCQYHPSPGKYSLVPWEFVSASDFSCGRKEEQFEHWKRGEWAPSFPGSVGHCRRDLFLFHSI